MKPINEFLELPIKFKEDNIVEFDHIIEQK